MKISCFIQRRKSTYLNHLNPEINKSNTKNAKTTEPEIIIFLEAQEAATHYFTYEIGLLSIFKIQQNP
jgi:hypothetical protein